MWVAVSDVQKLKHFAGRTVLARRLL